MIIADHIICCPRIGNVDIPSFWARARVFIISPLLLGFDGAVALHGVARPSRVTAGRVEQEQRRAS